MNVLLVGGGTAGSFIMRGRQLGAAIGARVTPHPTPTDWSWASVVVLVKRAARTWAAAARQAGVPIVWDALDFWEQPAQNGLGAAAAGHLLDAACEAIQPTLVIGATQSMAGRAGGVYLPHHGYLGLYPTPAREHVRTVAYAGNPTYLGAWRGHLERLCAARGWQFVVDPADVSAADILVALRDGPWDGWMCREWKSGVKLSNAILAGRPILTQPSAAASEMQPCGSTIHDVGDLAAAFDHWADHDRRAEVARLSGERAVSYRLEAVAAQYLATLATVRPSCAA